MKKIQITIVLVAALITARAQTPGEIWIEGKVVDVGTGKGIKSNIHYKSLPTGGITGSFKDSVYRFSIFGSSKYEISAQVDGYITAVAIVDPKKGVEGKILRNLTLTPKGQTIRLTHLIFEQGKSVIDPASFDELDEVAQMLIDHSKLVIQLEGHTDNQGSISKNMELSQDRVDEVKEYLVDKGVNKSRVKTKAFGGTKPLSNEKTVEARNLNRRVEIRILSE
jgi:outer membrane protein OmpA-like peptidoglycan-associated protein